MRRRSLPLLALTAIALALGAGIALASAARHADGSATASHRRAHRRHHRRTHHRRRVCSPSRGRLYPRLLSPCNGATVREHATVVFRVRDLNPLHRRYPPFLNLALSRRLRHGVLPNDTTGNGLYTQLRPVKGHPAVFFYRAPQEIYPSYWLNHPGTYYVQVQQVDARCRPHLTCYSPITTIHVR